MRRIATALLFFLFFPAIALAQAPVCDTTCGPNPGSGGYSGTLTARTELYNARGSSLGTVPTGISPATVSAWISAIWSTTAVVTHTP